MVVALGSQFSNLLLRKKNSKKSTLGFVPNTCMNSLESIIVHIFEF